MKAYRILWDVEDVLMDDYRRYRRGGYRPGHLRLERAGKRRMRALGRVLCEESRSSVENDDRRRTA